MAAGDEIAKEEKTTPVENQNMNNIPPREKMINTAVHFLLNPKVMKDGTTYQKKVFLQSKGLTEEEISLAFEKANIKDPSAGNSAYLPVVERPAHLHPLPSLWMRINHIGSSFIILAIACYGIHRAYKLYIEPWLFGEQHKEDRLTEMEHQLVELNRSLSHLRRSVGTIEDTLASQKTQLSKLCEEAIPSSELMRNPLIFNDIKSEIASIKSLFLGRQRFPPAPNVSPMIPSWQLEASSEKKNEEENSSVKENVSDPKEVEESLTAEPVIKELEGNSVSEECSKTPAHEILNSSVNGELGNLAANEVEA